MSRCSTATSGPGPGAGVSGGARSRPLSDAWGRSPRASVSVAVSVSAQASGRVRRLPGSLRPRRLCDSPPELRAPPRKRGRRSWRAVAVEPLEGPTTSGVEQEKTRGRPDPGAQERRPSLGGRRPEDPGRLPPTPTVGVARPACRDPRAPGELPLLNARPIPFLAAPRSRGGRLSRGSRGWAGGVVGVGREVPPQKSQLPSYTGHLDEWIQGRRYPLRNPTQ